MMNSFNLTLSGKHFLCSSILNEETRIQKNEERLRNLWDSFQHPNIWIIGVPEREEEEQEIENLFENIMKENFPNLAKEIDFQEVQEAYTKAHHN